MYITFDGEAGVGKSTQAEILKRNFDFDVSHEFHRMYHLTENFAVIAKHNSLYANVMAWILTAHNTLLPRANNVVEHFWGHLERLIDVPESDFSRTINFLRTGLHLGESSEPLLSFALQASSEVIFQRYVKREYGAVKVQAAW